MAELSYDVVSRLLKADFETGKLFWLPRPVKMFKSEGASKAWNTRYAGKEAFTAVNPDGYLYGSLNGGTHRAHRVMWVLAHRVLPVEIDHINGNRKDNRLENLRSVSGAENQKNKKLREDNKSGASGVFWHKQTQKWQAKIKVNGRLRHLGLFEDLNLAIACRKKAEVENGFHPNHGQRR